MKITITLKVDGTGPEKALLTEAHGPYGHTYARGTKAGPFPCTHMFDGAPPYEEMRDGLNADPAALCLGSHPAKVGNKMTKATAKQAYKINPPTLIPHHG